MINKKVRKGILLAGGTGSRLYPLTEGISKQLMPIYDKPMIYYPLSTLLLTGIKDILIICTPLQVDSFKRLLHDGSQLGINIKYKCQSKPDGIAQALMLGEKFLNGSSMCLILGDNLFYGDNLSSKLKEADADNENATIFAYQVKEPKRYGIVEFDNKQNIKNIEEKPKIPKSNYAVTGIYFYPNHAIDLAKKLTPSHRNELEISDLNKKLLEINKLKVKILRRGMAWLDTGTFDSLHDAGSFIKTIENRQGLKIGCPEELVWKMKYINGEQLKKIAYKYIKSSYGKYLLNLIQQ